MFLDMLIIASMYALTTYASFHDVILNGDQILNLVYFGIFFIIFFEIILFSFKVYFVLTGNFGINESLKVMVISLMTLLVGYVIMLLAPDDFLPHIHVEAFIISAIAAVFLIPAMRYLKRITRYVMNGLQKQDKIVRTVIIGAGAAARIVMNEAYNNHNSHSKIVAVVDDDPKKIGAIFDNVPVEGPIKNIAEIVNRYHAEEVVIAISSLSKERLKQIVKLLDPCDVKVKRLPLLSEMQGVSSMNVIDIDLDQLLGRDVVKLDNTELSKMLEGSTVLVTGAGGSIGSELAKQIYDAKPRKLVLFDIYENGIYKVQQDLIIERRKDTKNDVELIVLIGSTYNMERMRQIFDRYKPDFVYHAAAYKHVPLMEDSPQEAIRTNAFGTYNVASLANEFKIKKMVLVSTDKAVRPTNVMGATKRFAEMIMEHFASISTGTIFACVRFGNVLGSNGSVVPLFTKQIKEGGPVMVTDPEITRFFMTIPEAVSLILQSSIYAEKGAIFILDMGEPVKIVHLAEKMIRQAGFIPYKEMKIEFSGLRPGEKLYEEILLDVSKHKKTENSKIYIEEEKTDFPVEKYLDEISLVFKIDENSEIKEMLKSVVPTYKIDKKK
jgi:FlaA1/EpsC-like NDP-sugar epimerase